MNNPKKKPKSASQLRTMAQRVLNTHNVTSAPVQVENIARGLGARVQYSPFQDGDLAGMLVRGDDGQVVIGVNSLHHSNRQRFTIAHECGHLLLHRGDVHIDRTFRVNRRDGVSTQGSDAEEIEANRFAAEILMPYDMLIADIEEGIDPEDEETIRELAQKYQVSVQAMTHRISNILDDIL